jgi:LmbE family N-acetylglucosaminyl deacetylase
MKKFPPILIAIFLLLGGLIYFLKLSESPAKQNIPTPVFNTTGPLTIILSPHFDDAVLSLGGLMAKRENQLLVATFFAQKPTEIVHTKWDKISGFSDSDAAILARTKENENALMPFNAIIKNYDYPDFQYRKQNEDKEIEEEIAKDIGTLIKTYQNRELFIYGPATFGPKITHPDHQIVHDAFMDVFREIKKQNVHFLMYEDFPYVYQFTMSNLGDLNTYLEKIENMKLIENPIELNKNKLAEKISGIYTYKSQAEAFLSLGDDIGIWAQKFYQERCQTLLPGAYACEVVHTLVF